MRAQSFASSTNTGILYCAAKDHPSIDALRARPDLPTEHFEWLNRREHERGDLYGVLPLMKGMPVAMTDHIDRSIDTRILKGRVGHVHSWLLAKDETSTFKHGTRILTRVPKSCLPNHLRRMEQIWSGHDPVCQNPVCTPSYRLRKTCVWIKDVCIQYY